MKGNDSKDDDDWDCVEKSFLFRRIGSGSGNSGEEEEEEEEDDDEEEEE